MPVTVGEARQSLAAIDGTLTTPDVLRGKVEAAFKRLDDDNSGFLETQEARQLVTDLCGLMGFPVPTDEEFTLHFHALDANRDGKLSCDEVGSGIVGALSHKANSYRHFLAFADRDKLGDAAELPRE